MTKSFADVTGHNLEDAKEIFEELFSAANKDLREAVREDLHSIREDIQSDIVDDTNEDNKIKLKHLDALFATAIDAIDNVEVEQDDDESVEEET